MARSLGASARGQQPVMGGKMPGRATQQQINALQALPIDDMETSFLQLMIRHHEVGIAMARHVLSQRKLPVVTRLAQAIVRRSRVRLHTGRPC